LFFPPRILVFFMTLPPLLVSSFPSCVVLLGPRTSVHLAFVRIHDRFVSRSWSPALVFGVCVQDDPSWAPGLPFRCCSVRCRCVVCSNCVRKGTMNCLPQPNVYLLVVLAQCDPSNLLGSNYAV